MLNLEQKIQDLETRYRAVDEGHYHKSTEALLAMAKATEVLIALYKEKEDREFVDQAAQHLTKKV